MMECYQAYADYNDMMRLVEEMFRYVALRGLRHARRSATRARRSTSAPHWQRVSIPEAIDERTGIDIMRVTELGPLPGGHSRGRAAGRPEAELGASRSTSCSASMSQPLLIQPTFIIDHPVPLSPLAKKRPDQPLLGRALRADHRRHGTGQRFHRAERPDRPGAALSGAGPRLQRRRRRSSADGYATISTR